MRVIEALQKRRAVKGFDPNHRMPDETRRLLLEAATLTPSAFNIQHWRLLEVRDPEQRREIRKVAWDQPQVTDASLLLVLCADLDAWRDRPIRYWDQAPQARQEAIVAKLGEYYRDRPQVQRDEAMRSLGLFGMALMLAAQDLGYDSCPMDGFDFEAVAKLIRLPAHYAIGFMVAIGKGAGQPSWPRQRLPISTLMTVDRF